MNHNSGVALAVLAIFTGSLTLSSAALAEDAAAADRTTSAATAADEALNLQQNLDARAEKDAAAMAADAMVAATDLDLPAALELERPFSHRTVVMVSEL